MLVDFVFDLVRGICHEYTRVRVRCAHLSLWSLKSREEAGVDEGWLGILEFLRDITCKPKVRVLVDSAGDKTWDIGDFAKNMRE